MFSTKTIKLLSLGITLSFLFSCDTVADRVDLQTQTLSTLKQNKSSTNSNLVANKYPVTSPPEKSVKMGAGGFVTGVVIHPQEPYDTYVRTDNGGLFRLDKALQQWQQLIIYDRIGKHTSRSIESIAIAPSNPNILYTSVGFSTHKAGKKIFGYLLKSQDKGATWSVLGLSLPMTGNGEWRWVGERLAIDPHNENIVYYGSSLDGLWRSSNGGESWSQISSNLLPWGSSFGKTKNLPGVTFIEFDPKTAVNGATQVIYAGVAGKGVYQTKDGGNSWQALPNSQFSELVPQQGKVNHRGELIVTFYDSQPKRKRGSVWKFTGTTWQNITPQQQQNYSALAIDPNNSDRLIVATNRLSPQGIFHSLDGGNSWQTLKNKQKQPPWWPDWTFWGLTGGLAIDPGNSDRVWLTTGIGVWLAENITQNPVTWSAKIAGIEQTVAFDAVSTPGGASLITAIADWDGFRYTDIKQMPQHNHSQGAFTTTTSIAYSYGNPNFIVRVGGNQGNYQEIVAGFSNDNGVTWQNFPSITSRNHPSDLIFGNIAVSATNTQNIIWLPTFSAIPHYTKDGGATWNKVNDVRGQFQEGIHTHLWNRQQALAADTVEGNTFYIFHYLKGQLLRTDDSGETWIVANQNSPLPKGVKTGATLKTMPGVAGEIWVSLDERGLYRSRDRGNTFTKVAGVEQAKVFDFGKAADGKDSPTVLIQGLVKGQLGVFASTDLGQSWTRFIDLPTHFLSGTTTLIGDNNTFGRVYIGTTGNGFLYGDLNHKDVLNSKKLKIK